MKKEANYELKLTKEELINVWSALLYTRAMHKDQELPTTDALIKKITNIPF